MKTDRSHEQDPGAAEARPQDAPRDDQETPPAADGAAEPRAGAEPGEAAGGELQAMRERHLRLAAEFDNYRKRTERERSEAWLRAQAQLVEKLLEPLDDLQRVADFTAENTTVPALLEGIQMVERKLLRMLESAGLEVIDAQGRPFNPEQHEALMTAPTDDPAEDDQVGQVFQNGYQFKGLLLRPARVQVKKHEG